jgi:hypothetical protein
VLKCPNVEFYRKLLLIGEGFLLAEKLEGLSSHGLRRPEKKAIYNLIH